MAPPAPPAVFPALAPLVVPPMVPLISVPEQHQLISSSSTLAKPTCRIYYAGGGAHGRPSWSTASRPSLELRKVEAARPPAAASPSRLSTGWVWFSLPSLGGVKLPLEIVQQPNRATTSGASPQAMPFQSKAPAPWSPGFLLFAEDEGAQCREILRTTRFNLTWGKDDLVHGQQQDLQNSPWIHGEMLVSTTKALLTYHNPT